MVQPATPAQRQLSIHHVRIPPAKLKISFRYFEVFSSNLAYSLFNCRV